MARRRPAVNKEKRATQKKRGEERRARAAVNKEKRAAQKKRGEERRARAAANREVRHVKRRALGRPSATPKRARRVDK